MIILIQLCISKQQIQAIKFVYQLFRNQIQISRKVLLWNQAKSRMKACYSELVLYSSLQSRCHRCQLPLCALTVAETCTWRDLHLELECQILAKSRMKACYSELVLYSSLQSRCHQCQLPLCTLTAEETCTWRDLHLELQIYNTLNDFRTK